MAPPTGAAPWSECARRNRRWEFTGRCGAAARAAHAMDLVFGHADGHHRQLFDLTARRRADRDAVGIAEHAPAAALRRPVLDDLIDRPSWQQRAALALMPRLGARLAPRRILAAPQRRARRVGTRRLRGVPRRPAQLALQRRDPLILRADLRRQLGDLRLKTLVLRRQRQQHPHDGIAALLIDRLGLAPLHTTRFDRPTLCPPTQLNAYEKAPLCGAFSNRDGRI